MPKMILEMTDEECEQFFTGMTAWRLTAMAMAYAEMPEGPPPTRQEWKTLYDILVNAEMIISDLMEMLEKENEKKDGR